MSEITPEAALSACVAEAVGHAAEPRPGQASLARSMASAFEHRQHALAKAPTGTGKSLAALSQAGLRAALHGERTVISTHALTLQEQYVTKDAPPAIAAIRKLTGHDLRVAVLKGNGNYASISKLEGFLHAAGIQMALGARGGFIAASRQVDALSDAAALDAANGVSYAFRTADRKPTADEVRATVCWALDAHLDDEEPGDRQSCPHGSSEALWSLVSGGGSGRVSAKRKKSDDAVKAKPELAKERAAEADIVLTNHALLGIRAATGRQVVIDAPAVGAFDHVVVDEAHLLPGIVRDQGSRSCSGRTVQKVQSAARELSRAGAMSRWAGDGDAVRAQIERALRPLAGRSLEPGDDPLAEARASCEKWLAAASQIVKSVKGSASSLAREKFVEAVSELEDALDRTARHRIGSEVRWVEEEQGGHPALSVAPIAVGGLLWGNVWHRPAIEGRAQDDRHATVNQRGDVVVPLGMAAMSATLGVNAKAELGAGVAPTEHESPFLAAYAASALHIPVLPPEWWSGVLSDDGGGRTRFDLAAHEVWARGHAERLVVANGGRALLLTAKTSSGQALAEHLRRTLPEGIQVYSQWDQEGLDAAKAAWRADETGVLVGSKSLMTGVDAPGETCSLVWLDRPPRKPANPVDDGRVDAYVSAGGQTYAAREYVYAGDAADDLEQSAGRLIRSMSDGGMVVVADPRLAAGQPKSYADLTRGIYLAPLRHFGHRIPSEHGAAAWLAARRAALA